MRALIISFLIIILAACGSTPTMYQAKTVDLETAEKNVERYIMTQHREWRPDEYVMTNYYFGWSNGQISKGVYSGTTFGNSAFGTAASTTRNLNERVYYDQIKDVRLLSWKRKGKQWYVVSLIDENDAVLKHVLRTRSLKDAETMTDALTTLVGHKQSLLTD